MGVRIGVLVYMVCVTILFGWGTYHLLTLYEQRLGYIEYKSVVDDLGTSSAVALEKTFQATKMLSATVGDACPHASDWPNCGSMSFKTLTKYVDRLTFMAISSIMLPEQIESFENFTQDSTNFKEWGFHLVMESPPWVLMIYIILPIQATLLDTKSLLM